MSIQPNESSPQVQSNDAHPFDATTRAHPAVVRVRNALTAAGLADTTIVMREATHTAQAAAEALRCDVGEIAESIIFRAATGRSVLVITSGKNRVDEKKVALLINEKLGKADADFVREATGFVIGGVSPLAHLQPGIILLDEDLLNYAKIFPAAGHPNTMFSIAPNELVRITHAQVAKIRADIRDVHLPAKPNP
jgi:prolyl-tRNA editing enzyme YbaK/EbsC (Cys-tRNA(Pro) deacylase)